MSKIESYKQRLIVVNGKLDECNRTLIERKTQRKTYLKQLKEEYNLTDETEIENKLNELRQLYSETEKKLDTVLAKMENNLVKIEKKLNGNDDETEI